jgi:hypothetical protein
VSQIAGYTDMLYTSGDVGSLTLSNGDFNGDPGNDLGLLNAWFALGGRDLFMTGDDLASSLYGSGSAARTFLEDRMGVTFQDTDVRDNIAGQIAPLVVRTAANPVFMTVDKLDRLWRLPCHQRLRQCGAVRRRRAPGPVHRARRRDDAVPLYAAAILNVNGSGRVVSMNHDLSVRASPRRQVPGPDGEFARTCC